MSADIWGLWPDGSMCSQDEPRDFEDAMNACDDYMLVVVTQYEEDGTPAVWHRYRPEELK